MAKCIHVLLCVIPLNGYTDKFVPDPHPCPLSRYGRGEPFNQRYFNAILIVESLFEAGDIGIHWQGRGDHLAKPMIGVGMKWDETCELADPLLGVSRKLMTLIPYLVPIVLF